MSYRIRRVAALAVAVGLCTAAQCSPAGQSDVLVILQEAERAAGGITDASDRACQLADIAEARSHAGDLAGGLKLAKSLRKGNARDSALVTIVELQA